MHFGFSVRRLEAASVGRRELMAAFLATALEDFASTGSEGSKEESVRAETLVLLKFAEHRC